MSDLEQMTKELHEDCMSLVKQISEGNPDMTYEAASQVWVIAQLASIHLTLKKIVEQFNSVKNN